MAADARRTLTVRHRTGADRESYRAILEDGTRPREVIVRFLPETAPPSHRAVRELETLAAMRDPGIPRVIGRMRLRGRPALVTEDTEGDTLRRIIDRGERLPLSVVLEMVARVADLLELAANAEPVSLVHRDVCPANILLTQRGEVMLTDFVVWDRPPGMVGRTAAPEIRQGAAHRTASDLFSLADTAFEAVTGERLLPERTPLGDDLRDRIVERLTTHEMPTPVLDLLADLSEVDPSLRPSATDTAARARELATRHPGATVARWAAERAWHRPHRIPSELDGEVLVDKSDDGLSPLWSDLDGFDEDAAPTVEAPRPRIEHFDEIAVAGAGPEHDITDVGTPPGVAARDETSDDPRDVTEPGLLPVGFLAEKSLPFFSDSDEKTGTGSDPEQGPPKPPPEPDPDDEPTMLAPSPPSEEPTVLRPHAAPVEEPTVPATPEEPPAASPPPPPAPPAPRPRRPRPARRGPPVWAWGVGIVTAFGLAAILALMAILLLRPLLQALAG